MTTIIGMLIGIICIVVSMLLNGSLGNFIDIPSIFIVFGGIIASTVASCTPSEIKSVLPGLKVAFGKDTTDIEGSMNIILQLANTARREGLLALENATESIENRFLKKGIMLIVDGTDPALVKNILETESAYIQDRHAGIIGVFTAMQGYSPAYGLIGTLIGLINMLAFLDDQAMLAPSMAVALITTLYGTIFASLIFQPITNKLQTYSMAEELECEIIMEGVLSIQNGENPRLIKEKLLSFVSGADADVIGENIGLGTGKSE